MYRAGSWTGIGKETFELLKRKHLCGETVHFKVEK